MRPMASHWTGDSIRRHVCSKNLGIYSVDCSPFSDPVGFRSNSAEVVDDTILHSSNPTKISSILVVSAIDMDSSVHQSTHPHILQSPSACLSLKVSSSTSRRGKSEIDW